VKSARGCRRIKSKRMTESEGTILVSVVLGLFPTVDSST